VQGSERVKVLGVVFDRRLTFHKHVSSVARSCSYRARAIWHLLTTELAQKLACGLILSRIDYCNAVLHGAPSYSIKKSACAEQSSSDRSAGAKTISRQPVVEDVTLSARSAEDRVQSK